MVSDPLTSIDYWTDIQITQQDVEYLHNHLFELETPLTTRELVAVFVNERIRAERLAMQQRRQAGGKTYFPKESYQVGDELIFPALNWKHGTVTAVRAGTNPEIGTFDVLTVDLGNGSERLFASSLADHPLNDQPVTIEEEGFDVEAILREHESALEKKIEAAFAADDELVRIAGRWFPRALLVDINVGHLNLAEAVLDMAGGEPLATSALLKDLALPEGVNPKLAEFSLNLALQEDGRFDEVGPAGKVLWCLRRLEPEEVREIPLHLRYSPIEYDRSLLTSQMLNLEAQLDDELTEVQASPNAEVKEVTLALIYPHLRAGTLPLSARVRPLFPTAYESPRVRFTLVDGRTKQRMPGWVVREHGYVFGLREWYKANDLTAGSLVRIRRGEHPGEVIKRPFDRLVADMIREMSKLTPQGHVHAQELYSAVNIVRRVPPGPLFALLGSRPEFTHVGDLYFRLSEVE
jgi:hypothetical protein